MRPQGGAAIPPQEDDEAVREHGHAHQEVGQGQPVAGSADAPLAAVVAVEEHRVLEVALQGVPAVTLLPARAPPPPRQPQATPHRTPRDQTVSRSCADAAWAVGMLLLAVLPKGWPAMSWGQRRGRLLALWWDGTRGEGWLAPPLPVNGGFLAGRLLLDPCW